MIKETDRFVPHDEALNRMLQLVDTRYFVTLDSDIEILKEGWLELMLERIEASNADLVFADDFPVGREVIRGDEYSVPNGLKFSIWMALYRTQSVKKTTTPFKSRKEVVRTTSEGHKQIVYFDVGVELFHSFRVGNRATRVKQLTAYFIHYGSIAIAINRIGSFDMYFGGLKNAARRVRKRVTYLQMVMRNRFYGSPLVLKCLSR